jgi:hypothetical protein
LLAVAAWCRLGTSASAAVTDVTSQGGTVERDGARAGAVLDVVVVIALLVIGYVVRRDGLPTDGLFFDDAWVVTGAVHGRVADLLTVGSAHPGFTLLLKVWGHIGGGGLRSFAYPSLAVGVVGAPLLYLGLRWLKFPRSICTLAAAVLVISDVHVIYSGHVKAYTFDTAFVILLVAMLPTLARRTWQWPVAAAWVLMAFLLGTISGYLVVASALAMVILVLHPSSDRLVRIGALGAQSVCQVALYLAERRTSDLNEVEEWMESLYDGHLSLHLDPGRSFHEILTHLDRITDVYPGGSGRWLSVVALAFLAGLVVASVRGPRDETIVARFCLLLVIFAFVGGVLGKFPFGPLTRGPLMSGGSTGGRHTLWMVPAIAVGLAVVLRRVREVLGAHRAWRSGFDGLLVVAALMVVIVQFEPAMSYIHPGSASATAYLESRLRPGDVVILLDERVYLFALSTHAPFRLEPTPDHMVGFTPVFANKRITGLGDWSKRPASPREVRRQVRGAHRVLVFGTAVGPAAVDTIVPTLRAQGFVRASVTLHGENEVVVILTRAD